MIERVICAVVFVAFASGTAMGASTPGLKPIDPAALQASIEGLAKELMLPGAMVLLTTPRGNLVFGYGTTELGATNPPRADTHFRAASNTKTMTAAVIVQLVQEGKLSFDDLISKYAQGVPNGDAITIRQLLTMRSGLYNVTNAPELAESFDKDPDRVWTANEVLGIAFKRPPDFAPGCQIRVQQHQLHPTRPCRREDRRQATLDHLPGPPVRATRYEEYGPAAEHVECYPRALLTRLPVWWYLVRACRCSLSRGTPGRS